MSLNYKNPLSSNQNNSQQSIVRSANFGVTYSVSNTGGYMEVWTLNDLVLTGLTSPTPGQYVTGDTIPINILISNGTPFLIGSCIPNSITSDSRTGFGSGAFKKW